MPATDLRRAVLKSLQGKVVLIAGSGGSQGRAAALSFAANGARVLGCDMNAEASADTTRMVRGAGGEMHSCEPLELHDEAGVRKWVERAISLWGRIDILYNIAGRGRHTSFEDTTVEDFERTLRDDLTIQFITAKAVWPHMKAQGKGVILNTASLSGHLDIAGFPVVAHGAANAGRIAFSRTLASIGAEHGIRCVSISPGVVDGPMMPPQARDAMSARVPLKRAASAQEIANVAMFLASDEASYVTGTDIAVDGGASGIIWSGAV